MLWRAEMRRGGSNSLLYFVLMLNRDDERELFQQLERTYTPDADAFCGNLVQKLESAAERHTADCCEYHLRRWCRELIAFSIKYGRCCFSCQSI